MRGLSLAALLVAGGCSMFFYSFTVIAGGGGRIINEMSQVADQNALVAANACSSENRQMIRSVLIPMSVFTFQFERTGKFERRAFLATVHCGSQIPPATYITHAKPGPPVYDEDMRVYDMGIGETFRLLPRDPSVHYLCTMRLRPNTDDGRGCSVDVDLGIGFSAETGLSLMVEYGIDFPNRRHIPQIDADVQRYFHRLRGLGLEPSAPN